MRAVQRATDISRENQGKIIESDYFFCDIYYCSWEKFNPVNRVAGENFSRVFLVVSSQSGTDPVK